MNQKHPILRASEINTYLYCQRAWGYQRQNIPSFNTEEMDVGVHLHKKHSVSLRSAIWLRRLGLGLLLLALLLLLVSLATMIST
ncbi:MAG: hypothetical protein ACOY16_13675 [Chloroflexota bacterium]